MALERCTKYLGSSPIDMNVKINAQTSVQEIASKQRFDWCLPLEMKCVNNNNLSSTFDHTGSSL